MTTKDYKTHFLVEQTPLAVFDAVNHVRGWWSEQVEGSTDQPGAVFKYHYKNVHRCELQIIEFVPGETVVWSVIKNYFDFTKDKSEWTGSRIIFDISTVHGQTKLTFTHAGLVPDLECYEICSDAWTNYIGGSLKSLVETGTGMPNPYIPAIENAEAMKGGNHE